MPIARFGTWTNQYFSRMASTRSKRKEWRTSFDPLHAYYTQGSRRGDKPDGRRHLRAHVHELCLQAPWFVVSQTVGEEFTPPHLSEWDKERAISTLDIEQIAFTHTDGNCQGYARKRQIAINPVAQLPHKTLFHEMAHVMLGHTTEIGFTDTDRTPKNLREVEAEAVALLL